jgi:hypothetical protein
MGLLSLLAVVFTWGGVWLLLDHQVPGGLSLLKELLLALIGWAMMVQAGSFFPSAYMEAVVAPDLVDDAAQELGQNPRNGTKSPINQTRSKLSTFLEWCGVSNRAQPISLSKFVKCLLTQGGILLAPSCLSRRMWVPFWARLCFGPGLST